MLNEAFDIERTRSEQYFKNLDSKRIGGGDYMSWLAQYCELAIFRLQRSQTDEAIELIKNLKVRLNQLDGSPYDFFGNESAYNNILLLAMIVQYEDLLRQHPQHFANVISRRDFSALLNDESPSGASHINAYFRGLSLLEESPPRAYQFFATASRADRYLLRELAVLMQIRTIYAMADESENEDSLAMYHAIIERELKPKSSVPSFKDDIEEYASNIEGERQRLQANRQRLNRANNRTPNYPAGRTTGQPVYNGPQLDRPLTKKELIDILRKLIKEIQDGN